MISVSFDKDLIIITINEVSGEQLTGCDLRDSVSA